MVWNILGIVYIMIVNKNNNHFSYNPTVCSFQFKQELKTKVNAII